MTAPERDAAVLLTNALESQQQRIRRATIIGFVSILVLLALLAGAIALELHTRGTVRVVSRSPCARLSAQDCAAKLAPFLRDAIRELDRKDRAARKRRSHAPAHGAAAPSKPSSSDRAATRRPGMERTRRVAPRAGATRPGDRADASPGPQRRKPKTSPADPATRPPSTTDASPAPAPTSSPSAAPAPQASPAAENDASPSSPSTDPPATPPTSTTPAVPPAPAQPLIGVQVAPVGPITLPPVCTPLVALNCQR